MLMDKDTVRAEQTMDMDMAASTLHTDTTRRAMGMIVTPRMGTHMDMCMDTRTDTHRKWSTTRKQGVGETARTARPHAVEGAHQADAL